MTHAFAHTILAHHGALQTGEPRPLSDCIRPEDSAQDALVADVRAACRSLGFVEDDAQLLARAWTRQTERTGQADASAWPTAPEDFGVDTRERTDAFAPCPQPLGLYAVLPDAQWVGRMARAGVPTVQLRFKCDDRRATLREVQAAVRAVQDTGSQLFINDHWREAIEAGAHGVHLGQEDLEGARDHLETIRAAGLRLGLSTHGYAELLRAESVAPSYLALGAVYPTTLKRMATAPQGPGRLAAYARLMRHRPLVAIGGIDFARLDEVLPSGVGSVAVVRALVAATDPEMEAKRFMARMAQLQTPL
ncbi:MAG: thiamine phosphate synthase [Betaproteobacteria bacterium]|nr:thiamine phosphate synthase [Betaproteobacteria bacterium]